MRDVISAPFAILRSGSPRLIRRESLRNEWRRLYWKRLSGRSHLAGNIALGDRPLFDGENRLASVAVQDIEKAGLVALDDDGDVFAIEMQGGEQGRRGTIEIPKIVMDELKAPNELPGFAAQGNNGVGPLVVAGAEAAVIVGAGAACGNKQQVTLLVHSHDRPSVAGAAAPRRGLAFRGCDGGICGKRIPTPTEHAGARVVGTDDAASHVHAMVVVNRGADHDEVINDGGRGSHVVPARVVLKNVAQADLAFFAEVGARGSSGRVYGDEASILSGFKDAATAGPIFGTRCVEPNGHATIDEAVAIV